MIGINFKLTPRQHELLNFMNDKGELNKGGTFLTDISPGFSTNIIENLMKKGLLSEFNHSNDILYYLTDKGRLVLDEANA